VHGDSLTLLGGGGVHITSRLHSTDRIQGLFNEIRSCTYSYYWALEVYTDAGLYVCELLLKMAAAATTTMMMMMVLTMTTTTIISIIVVTIIRVLTFC